MTRGFTQGQTFCGRNATMRQGLMMYIDTFVRVDEPPSSLPLETHYASMLGSFRMSKVEPSANVAHRTALLAGATGLVGRSCLERLLASDTYERVRVLVRRSVGMSHDKLEELRVDFDALESLSIGAVDDVFITLGTTMKTAGSKEAFYKVDHDYVVATAKLGKRSGASRLALVSSIGVGGPASNYYLSVKGETERDVIALGYECLEIFRPGLLVGDRQEKRTGEALGIAAVQLVGGLFLGPLRQYRPIEATAVAAAMVAAIRIGEPGVHVRTFEEMKRLASGSGFGAG